MFDFNNDSIVAVGHWALGILGGTVNLSSFPSLSRDIRLRSMNVFAADKKVSLIQVTSMVCFVREFSNLGR